MIVSWSLVFSARSAGGMVEERPVCSEVGSVRTGGAHWSENIGISSIKESENLSHRKPKVSPTTMIGGG